MPGQIIPPLMTYQSYSQAAKLNFGGQPCTEGLQWFIAVLISPNPTFQKTSGCQAGNLEHFEKIQDGRQNGRQNDHKIENCTERSPLVIIGHVVAHF